jgi:hypothetical protein
VINPRDFAHNYVVVLGVRSPGRARLTGVTAPYKWDELPSYGMEGATIRFRGRGIAHPTLSLWFFEDAHFVQWDVFQQLLKPPTQGKPFMVEMQHPLLSAADIKAVSVEEIQQPERQDNGMWIATIKLIEYRPLVPAAVVPRGSIPSVSVGAPIPPATDAQAAVVADSAALAAAYQAARL